MSITQLGCVLYSLLFLGYKPAQDVTILNAVGNLNIILLFVYLKVFKYRKGTVKYGIKGFFKKYTNTESL